MLAAEVLLFRKECIRWGMLIKVAEGGRRGNGKFGGKEDVRAR